jgi:hypothetical protein
MTTTPLTNTECLHDALVSEICVKINASGERQLRLRLRCDPNCGYDIWDDKVVDVTFHDPVVVISELFGHMANAESLDSWNSRTSDAMAARIKTLRESGLQIPQQVVQLVFHSGSTIEIAYGEVEFMLPIPS